MYVHPGFQKFSGGDTPDPQSGEKGRIKEGGPETKSAPRAPKSHATPLALTEDPTHFRCRSRNLK